MGDFSHEAAIQISNVTKSFGNMTVLHEISMELVSGHIYGLVGRNGSGKSVLMKLISGFLCPDSGTILVNGRNPFGNSNLADDMGILIEEPGYFPQYTGLQNLKAFASVRASITEAEIRDTLKTVGLDPDLKKKVCNYSMGMKQRLGIAQAIMEKQQILLLDEPMNGLDNTGVMEMRTLFLNKKKQGSLIILASHNAEDIRILCDHIYMLDAGKMSE